MSRVRTIVKPVGISRKKEIFYGQKKKKEEKKEHNFLPSFTSLEADECIASQLVSVEA